jgi:hypothetical protein
MVLRIAGAQEETPVDMSAFSPMEPAAASFTSEALARSIMIVDDGSQSLDLFGTQKEPPSVTPEPEAAPESPEAAPEQTPEGSERFAIRPARDSKPPVP